MANTIQTEALLQKEVIRLKDKKTIIKPIADTKYEGQLKQQGDTVSVQTFPDVFGNVFRESADSKKAGGPIEIQDWAITKEQLQVNEVFQNGARVLDIEEVRSNVKIRAQLAERFAFASANNEDQFIASLVTQAYPANKIRNHNPVTLSNENTYSSVTVLKQVLSERNAFNKGMLFVDPAIHAKLRLEDILDATQKGLDMRLNGRIGMVDGFDVMETNNLPHVILLEMPDNPVENETVQISGRKISLTRDGYETEIVTFTFQPTAAAPGDVRIGATPADTQENLVNAINGTGTPGGTSYIELDAAQRTALNNGFVHIEDFVANEANVQSSVTMDVAETFASANNKWGKDAVLMFAADKQAINFASQMDKFKIKDLNDRFAANILQEKVYDGKVFAENGKGLASVEIEVTAPVIL